MLLTERHKYKPELVMLHEFGFTDFIVNEHLIEKYKDVNQVADLLMNGQVSDESIRAIYRHANVAKRAVM